MHLHHRRYYWSSYDYPSYTSSSYSSSTFADGKTQGIFIGSVVGGVLLIAVAGFVVYYFYEKSKKKKVPRTQTVPTGSTQQPRDTRERITRPDPPAVLGYNEPTAPPPTYKDSRYDRAYMDPTPGNDVILVDADSRDRAMVRAQV
ncbi:uncharacterized protein CXQ87_003412 [Candidozyma duobushaemuli]|uniref:Uncharacterized protein n=1 Tax=Candidozyma duobushaemuli TaxID=1231522 RepID=A0A2V1ACA3_9ASCO|nr:uncharacterized protein CXQ87_003412 [[Candida] duobushaemulonis]PVH15568.1 hypothetical protein CXQ87_003412 [[Candida] duobushaemulonis]